MANTVQALAMRLAAVLDMPLDPEWIDDDACWSVITRLSEMKNAGAVLTPGVIAAINDLSSSLRLKGDEALVHATLEAHFGPSPLSTDEVIEVVRYVRGQIHFAEQQRSVDIDPASTHVPLKNLDYK